MTGPRPGSTPMSVPATAPTGRPRRWPASARSQIPAPGDRARRSSAHHSLTIASGWPSRTTKSTDIGGGEPQSQAPPPRERACLGSPARRRGRSTITAGIRPAARSAARSTPRCRQRPGRRRTPALVMVAGRCPHAVHMIGRSDLEGLVIEGREIARRTRRRQPAGRENRLAQLLGVQAHESGAGSLPPRQRSTRPPAYVVEAAHRSRRANERPMR